MFKNDFSFINTNVKSSLVGNCCSGVKCALFWFAGTV